MVNISDRTVSSVIGVPSPTSNTNDFGWAGGGTRTDGVIPPTPEDNTVRRFVVLRNDGTTAYSEDAISWQTSSHPASGLNVFSAVYADNKFVGVGGNGSTNNLVYSVDGVTWSLSTIPDNQIGWHQVVYGNDRFVAVGSAYFNSAVATSTDGITWTPGASYAFGFGYYPALGFGEGKFVVVPTFSSATFTSEDGVTWSLSYNMSTYGDFNIAYGNETFVAVNANGGGAYSSGSEGRFWSYTSDLSFSAWAHVVYGADRFVTISGTGTVATSTDGVSWGNVSNLNASIRSITYGNGKFVAISDENSYFSTDGVSWDSNPIPNGIGGLATVVAYGQWPQIVI